MRFNFDSFLSFNWIIFYCPRHKTFAGYFILCVTVRGIKTLYSHEIRSPDDSPG